MKAKHVVVVLTIALAAYFVLAIDKAFALIGTGQPMLIVFGVAVFVVPLIGVWITVATLRFGRRTERLAQLLDAEGGLPDTSALPRLPSGRVDRAAADEWFVERKAETEAAPTDWRVWFRLAHAYDIAGDRTRARAAMRKAVDLEAGTDGE